MNHPFLYRSLVSFLTKKKGNHSTRISVCSNEQHSQFSILFLSMKKFSTHHSGNNMLACDCSPQRHIHPALKAVANKQPTNQPRSFVFRVGLGNISSFPPKVVSARSSVFRWHFPPWLLHLPQADLFFMDVEPGGHPTPQSIPERFIKKRMKKNKAKFEGSWEHIN